MKLKIKKKGIEIEIELEEHWYSYPDSLDLIKSYKFVMELIGK